MSTPHMSAEHRDEICREMVSTFVKHMKSDSRIGEKWQGLSAAEQDGTGASMFNKLRPLMDDLEAVAINHLDWD